LTANEDGIISRDSQCIDKSISGESASGMSRHEHFPCFIEDSFAIYFVISTWFTASDVIASAGTA